MNPAASIKRIQLATLAAVAACAAVGALLLLEGLGSPERKTAASAALPASGKVAGGSMETKPGAVSVGRDEIAPGAAYTLAPPFVILDAVTIATDGGTPTRLAAVTGPAAEAVCVAADGHLWACGLRGRAALNGLVRQQTVSCVTVEPAQGQTDGSLNAACRVGDVDLASAMVLSGFARPLSPAGGLAREEAIAREQARGLWAGGWSIRP